MVFRYHTIDAIFLCMKSVEACLKLYNDKDHHTNGNTHSQSGSVDEGVIPVAVQTSECCFERIFKHKQAVLDFKGTIEMPVYKFFAYQLVSVINTKRSARF